MSLTLVAQRANQIAQRRIGPLSVGQIVDSLVPMVGAGVAQKLKELLMTRKFGIDIYSVSKEWTGLLMGVATTILYELFRNRLPQSRLMDAFVFGISAGLGAESIAVLTGEPFAFIDKDGKVYVKNISGTQLKVFVDGTEYTYDTTNNTWGAGTNISEGDHYIAIIGDKGCYYVHQYTPNISA